MQLPGHEHRRQHDPRAAGPHHPALMLENGWRDAGDGNGAADVFEGVAPPDLGLEGSRSLVDGGEAHGVVLRGLALPKASRVEVGGFSRHGRLAVGNVG